MKVPLYPDLGVEGDGEWGETLRRMQHAEERRLLAWHPLLP